VDRSRDHRFIGLFQEAFRMDRHATEGLGISSIRAG
jgi:hypothetical protein